MMSDIRCTAIPALFGVLFPVLLMLLTTGNAVSDALHDSSCPSICTCVSFSECEWCAAAPLTTPDSKAVTSSSSAVSDDVSCEGCGEPSDTSKSIRRRSMTSSAQHPVPETIVSCVNAGLVVVPFHLPASMSTLDLSGNQLRQLDPGFLEFAPTNVDIHLTSEEIGADGSHFDGPRIVNLRLRNNRIHWITPGSFRGPSAASIRVLDLADNRITGIESGVFVGPIAESLEQLDLSGNFIRDLGDESFLSLRKLTRLDLRGNLLSELGSGAFRGLSSLRQLVLASNSITSIDRRTFKPLENLVYIVLKGNPLGEQSIRFQFSSHSLTYIDLSECQLTDVPKGLPGSSRYLQLRRNNITWIGKSSFIESPFINILVLDDNHISDIEEGSLERLTRLQQLWIGGNRLRKIPAGLSASVKRLLLDFNQIENVTDVFPFGSQLESLSLTGNLINSLTNDAFVKLTDLQTLDLANNVIRRIEPDTFRLQSALRVLQLSGNPLQTLPSQCFNGLKSLAVLSLAYVPSDEILIDPHTFNDVTRSLVRLDIDGSPSIARFLFSPKSGSLSDSLLRVQELNVRSSDLVHLNLENLPMAFRNTSTTDWSILRLSSSHWHCDSGLIWLRDRLLGLAGTSDVTPSSSLTSVKQEVDSQDNQDENLCLTPKRLAGRLLMSLSDNEFEVVNGQVRDTTVISFLTQTFMNTVVATPAQTVTMAATQSTVSPYETFTKRVFHQTGSNSRGTSSVASSDLPRKSSLTRSDVRLTMNEGKRRERWESWKMGEDLGGIDTDAMVTAFSDGRRQLIDVILTDRSHVVPVTSSTGRNDGIIRPFHRSSPVPPLRLSDDDIDLLLQERAVTRRSAHGRAVIALPVGNSDESQHPTDGTASTTMYAVLGTIVVTVIVAVAILTVIIRLVCDKKPFPVENSTTEKPSSNCDVSDAMSRGIVEYQHNNGTLYFERQHTSVNSTPVPSRCTHLSSPDVTASISLKDHYLPTILTGNDMTSSPTNIEALRTYKWEDF